LTWGAGDFGGGVLSRRAPVLTVVLISQVAGSVGALAIALLIRESMPAPADLPWALAGGLGGGIGITALYHGLSTGRMGVVAPVTGVLSAGLPVLFGVVTEGLPGFLVIIGIGLAIVAVVLVSRVQDERSGDSGLRFALIAGLALGTFGISASRFSEGHTFGLLSIVRAIEALLITVIVIAGHRRWRAPRRLLPAMAGVGALDMAGNATFILAAQAGSLAIAAVLSSLYPVTTVILAAVVLRERITRSHAVGIALAAAAIVTITIGST
jgi:uncharacterized membrane protein